MYLQNVCQTTFGVLHTTMVTTSVKGQSMSGKCTEKGLKKGPYETTLKRLEL